MRTFSLQRRARSVTLACSLILALSRTAVAMQQAIPLKDKVAESDLVIVAKVESVITQRLFFASISFDSNDGPRVIYRNETPIHDVIHYLDALHKMQTQMEDHGNAYGAKCILELRSHYLWGCAARCTAMQVLKGELRGPTAEVFFKRPIDGYTVVPSPWILYPDQEYILFLSSNGNGFVLTNVYQGAHLVSKVYRELDVEADGLNSLISFSHDRLLRRIKEIADEQK
jgi:hypothetical protein